ncbi:hypothetical protein NDU88_005662 [Pleurodeles waltl]|uniref:Uncharacterized protein n=1 Tax=Pleurodeles waltl TaxID=8319 RepID=A0AAV7PHH1_PLEWA|nr:hypothetical protein NDU88_005662 [Pleurodeles waltl]
MPSLVIGKKELRSCCLTTVPAPGHIWCVLEAVCKPPRLRLDEETAEPGRDSHHDASVLGVLLLIAIALKAKAWPTAVTVEPALTDFSAVIGHCAEAPPLPDADLPDHSHPCMCTRVLLLVDSAA